MKRSSAKITIAALVLAVMSAVGVSCARSERAATQPSACEPGATPVVDSVLLAFLSKARAAHHKADLAEASGDVAGAIASLESLTGGARPGGATPLPEASEVLSDTYARLADLRSARSEFDTALRDVDAGLALAQETTYFRGHLFEVRGLVEERRAKSLPEGADRDRARKAAMDAFDEAVRIQDQVISSALGDGGAR
ncbi:hypothetical protein [Polyangium mundeleinium]|uniref:DUF4398 domain-containing protein n=1 Tax=Polyangium mundeleinium TaxID=2995306 RepID=A0ABT5EVM7_9BACT|nr:hypothetical protein [Polyangium mundeleinium]MDC0745875.1 hypothetical protein [Polyangium mundeleinium]